MPEIGKDLVEKLLLSDPTQRLTLASIKEHPFFEGMDWDTLFTSTPPALKERLEAKQSLLPPPAFDFDQDEEEEEEDIWEQQQQQKKKKVNPFQDHSSPSSSTSTHNLKQTNNHIPERQQAHPPW